MGCLSGQSKKEDKIAFGMWATFYSWFFVHVDQVSFEHVDYVTDIRRLSMFDDETAELIYACQVWNISTGVKLSKF